MSIHKIRTTETAGRALVRVQNMEFKNGVAHVVTVAPVKAEGISAPDAPTAAVPTDRILVSKDAYIQNGTSATRSFPATADLLTKTSPSDPNFERRILFQFPIRQPSFPGRLGSAKIVTYIASKGGTTNGGINFYEDQNVDWVEASLTWNNSPAFGTQVLGGVTVNASTINKRVSADITSIIQSYINNSKAFINIGAYGANTDLIGIRSRQSTAGSSFAAYIDLFGTPPTILTKVNNGQLTMSKSDNNRVVTLNDLQFSGTVNKNIIYTLTTAPTSGYVTRADIPLEVGSVFNQDDIDRGLVKYLYSGSAAGSDSFVVEVKDYQGGYFDDLITVPVQIQ